MSNNFAGNKNQKEKVWKYENQKEFIVSVSKTVIYKWTVVIKHFSAFTAE